MKPSVILTFIGVLLATAASSYWAGYNVAQNKYTAQIAIIKNAYAQASLFAANEYQRQLSAALEHSQTASRNFLVTQARIQKENTQLKEQLNEARTTLNVTACTVGAEWLHYYSEALGVPTANSNGIDIARSADDTAVTATALNTTELLQHVIDYGAWCQNNTAQLSALQQFLRNLNSTKTSDN